MIIKKVYPAGSGSRTPARQGFLTAHEGICLVLLRSRSDTVRRNHCVRPGHGQMNNCPNPAAYTLVVCATVKLIIKLPQRLVKKCGKRRLKRCFTAVSRATQDNHPCFGEYAVLDWTPGSRPIWPVMAAMISCGASMATLMMLTPFWR